MCLIRNEGELFTTSLTFTRPPKLLKHCALTVMMKCMRFFMTVWVWNTWLQIVLVYNKSVQTPAESATLKALCSFRALCLCVKALWLNELFIQFIFQIDSSSDAWDWSSVRFSIYWYVWWGESITADHETGRGLNTVNMSDVPSASAWWGLGLRTLYSVRATSPPPG